MSAFTHFDPPHERLRLQRGSVAVELWPGVAGAVASMRWLGPGAPVDILRPTARLASYSPKDLACWALLPYSNRLRDGRLVHAGTTWRLPVNHEGFLHPQHGLAWIRPWQVHAASADAASLVLACAAGRDWPFAFEARLDYRLLDDGLEITTSLRNLAGVAAPVGLGQHPYLHRPRGARLQAQVGSVWRCDGDVLPVARVPLPAHWNLPAGCDLDGVAIDNCFEDFAGEAWLHLPGGARVQVQADASCRHVIVYNPPDGPFVCVEPATHMPDAANLALVDASVRPMPLAAPGDTMQVRHRIRYHPPAQ
jgi:aldose 1-epimerase